MFNVYNLIKKSEGKEKKRSATFFSFFFLFFPFFFSFSTTADSTCGHPTDNQIKPNTCVVPSNRSKQSTKCN